MAKSRRKARKGVPKGSARRPSGLFKGNASILCLWLILLLGVFLIHAFYTGPYLKFDDNSYMTLAGDVSAHTFNPILTPRAFGWLFPYISILSEAVFGSGQSGIVAFTALEYLSLIFLTYMLAMRVLKDEKAALLSAFLVCIFPFTIQYSTRLLPDMLLGVIALLSAIFLMSNRKVDWVLAGAMAGFLIYVKMMGLAFVIPFAILALFSRKRNYVIIPMLVVLVIYTVPFIVTVHSPLYAFQNYGAFQESLSPTTPQNNLVGLMLMASLFQEYQMSSINFQNYQLGLLLWLAALGTILAIKYRDRMMAAMAVIFWFFLLYLAFGTISLSGYVAGSLITRYLIVVAAPLAILVAYAVKNIVVKFPIRGRSNWVHIALFLIVMAGILITLLHTYHLVYFYNEMIRLNPAWVPTPS